jgi:1-acyl-sn-glycerol-3-phosphate acyltransferase
VRTFLQTTLFWGYLCLTLPAWFVFLALVWLVTLPFDRNLRVLHKCTCAWGGHIMMLNPMWRMIITGKEKVPRKGAFIFCSNHQSAGDIAVIMSTYLPFKWVSKHTNFRLPFLGWAMSLNAYVKVVRGSTASAKKMIDACKAYLARGVSVMMFPEGTRTLDGWMLPFKMGSFTLSMETGAPIVPIVLDNTLEALPKSAILAQKQVLDVRVKIGEPIDPKDYPNARALLNATRAAMEKMQRECWAERGYEGPPAKQTAGEREVEGVTA